MVLQKAQDSPEETEEEDEESVWFSSILTTVHTYTHHAMMYIIQTKFAHSGMEDSDEPQWKVLKLHKGKSELMRASRPILEESMEEKLENMGLRKVQIDSNKHRY